MIYRHEKDGLKLALEDFVLLVWDIAENDYEKETDDLWCNLTREEQIHEYCKVFERLINNGWSSEK